MKLKRMLSLLTSRELRKDAKSADERLRGRKPSALARSLSAEAEKSAQIAYDLAVIGRDVYGKTVEPEKIAAAAMFHDVWGGETPRYNAVLSFDAETPEYALYLRAADLLVSYLHCRDLAAEGQGQYEEAEVQMLEAIHELALPEAEDYLARLYGANIHNETEEE